MNLNDKIYLHSVTTHTPELVTFWNDVRTICGDGGNFYLDLSKRLHTSRYVSRSDSVWTTPWPHARMPGFEMPAYDTSFSKTFAEIVDEQALSIKPLIAQGEKFALFYSGGIDSTVVIFSLIKNLTAEELKSIAICGSVDSILENPDVWRNHIYGKFTILDSATHWMDDVIKLGYRPITAEPADLLMGTVNSITMHHNYDGYISHLSPSVRQNLKAIQYKASSEDTHYSLYKDIIIRYLAYDTSPEGLKFGELYYFKYVKCIETSSVPIHSLFDFFWWINFNLRWLNCLLRTPLYFNDTVPKKECIDKTIAWFANEDFQRWAMVNNNNGQKIGKTIASYKYIAREYIRDFDKNQWYFYFKSKIESLGNMRTQLRSKDLDTTLGLDTNYNMLPLSDHTVREYFKYHMTDYKLDWA
jgi:hypothetical protein